MTAWRGFQFNFGGGGSVKEIISSNEAQTKRKKKKKHMMMMEIKTITKTVWPIRLQHRMQNR